MLHSSPHLSQKSVGLGGWLTASEPKDCSFMVCGTLLLMSDRTRVLRLAFSFCLLLLLPLLGSRSIAQAVVNSAENRDMLKATRHDATRQHLLTVTLRN